MVRKKGEGMKGLNSSEVENLMRHMRKRMDEFGVQFKRSVEKGDDPGQKWWAGLRDGMAEIYQQIIERSK